MKVRFKDTVVRVRLKHFLHPLRSSKTLYGIIKHQLVRYLAERHFRNIRRGQRDRCWCGGELLPFKWHRSYGVCANCGCYVNRYPPLNLQELYSFDFYWHVIQRFHGNPTIEHRAQAYKSDGRLDYWLQIIQRYGPKEGTVIEVGCSPGILLAELQARGYRCIGVEPDERTARWIRENMGVEVQTGLFPEVDLPFCDLFLAFDVLEHSPCPDRFLQEAARLLNPEGIAILQTHVERYDYHHPFKERPDLFNDLEHLFLFTDTAIFRLASLARLEILKLEDNPCLLGHTICVFKKSSPLNG